MIFRILIFLNQNEFSESGFQLKQNCILISRLKHKTTISQWSHSLGWGDGIHTKI